MADWSNAQIRILINERRNRNVEFHNLGRNRINFWESIAIKINEEHNTYFNGYQCKKKFDNLVRDYNLMCKFLAGNARGRRTRNGMLYYDEFQSRFWERSEDEFDRIHLAKLFETLNFDAIRRYANGEKIASQGDRNISMLIRSIMDKKIQVKLRVLLAIVKPEIYQRIVASMTAPNTDSSEDDASSSDNEDVPPI
nr:5114_t:CDS:2 [Entrophospora candida]